MNQGETGGDATTISYGQRTLLLDSWELECLKETLGGIATPAEHSVLITEIVALLLKCMADSERFAEASSTSVEQFYGLQAELMLDSNLGNSLIGRTRRAVDSLVQQGMMQEARQLSGTMHKLRGSLIEVNRNAGTKTEGPSIDHNDVPTIATSRQLVDRLADPIDETDSRPVDTREVITPAGESALASEAPVVNTARTRALAVAFVVTFAIWFLGVELPRLVGSYPPRLKISDLQAPVVEVAIHSRWPSLYVEARSAAWSALEPEERRRLVTDLIERASERGFTSMLVRTVDGRPLAQWWRDRDVRWIDAGPADRSFSAGSNLPDAIETGPPAS